MSDKIFMPFLFGMSLALIAGGIVGWIYCYLGWREARAAEKAAWARVARLNTPQ